MTRAVAVCRTCARAFPLAQPLSSCPCGGTLSVRYPPGFWTADRFPHDLIRRRSGDQWRYREALLVPHPDRVISLGEGFTPLCTLPWAGQDVHFKLDFLNPTGSFKDRGASMVVSWLVAQGIRDVVLDSSGNAGASMAAYAARAGLSCSIYVPQSASSAKQLQSRLYGARVIPVAGSRETVATLAQRSGEAFYANHSWHPLFLEGTRSLAYEIWEQLGYRAPGTVILPTGGGSSLLGCHAGFRALREAAVIDSVPCLIAAQPRNCAPLAVLSGQMGHEQGAGSWLSTSAEGAAIANPIRGDEIVAALTDTGGYVETVTEQEIWAAVRDMARSGLYIEPTAALGPAAMRQLSRRDFAMREPVVVVLTGSGLKIGPAMDMALSLS